ncbi:MAG TPA: hypothetical protein VKY85_01425 [Candidatus Angelobacter sp.]|nr:hypothetical protein [Candidatus Angelobacter sp.]
MTDLANRTPIICLDFDGVCHSYTSGWKGARVIPDPPVPGMLEAIYQYSQHFEVNIFSSRSNQDGGIDAMRQWIIEELIVFSPWWTGLMPKHKAVEWVDENIKFPKEKPPAFVGIDDRVITFSGRWPTVEELKGFQPWHKRDVSGQVTSVPTVPAVDWPDPTPWMLNDPLWNVIWEAIKTWDINVPAVYGGYMGATGNHATAIFNAIRLPKDGRPRLSRKHLKQARRREKRAVLGQMPYRDADQWAEGMVQIKGLRLNDTQPETSWQVVLCGYEFPAKKDKAEVERHAESFRRVIRRKLRHYAAQEKRALCAVFGQRQKEGRDILAPERIMPPRSAEPPEESAMRTLQIELELIDEALARRPALDKYTNRYSKVYAACEIAGKAEFNGDRQRLSVLAEAACAICPDCRAGTPPKSVDTGYTHFQTSTSTNEWCPASEIWKLIRQPQRK